MKRTHMSLILVQVLMAER